MQLDQIKTRAVERAAALSIGNVVRNAKIAAQAGSYQQAIQSLRSCAEEHPGAFAVEKILEEVNCKVAHVRAVQLAQEAKQLISQVKESPTLGQLEEAQHKLSQASELDPSNQAFQQALSEVGAKISAERSLASTPALPDEQVEDDILLARVIEPVEQQVEAETVESDVEPQSVADAQEIRSAPQASAAPATPTPAGHLEPAVRRRFAEDEEEILTPTQRLIDAASKWSTVLKPFLVDNVGWFVGTFLVIAGFIVLILSFWGSIEQNRILMHSLVYFSLAATTGMFFAMAYFMRLKYPQLENSSNVLLVIVALLIPLVFAAAVLTTLVPAAPTEIIVQASMG